MSIPLVFQAKALVIRLCISISVGIFLGVIVILLAYGDGIQLFNAQSLKNKDLMQLGYEIQDPVAAIVVPSGADQLNGGASGVRDGGAFTGKRGATCPGGGMIRLQQANERWSTQLHLPTPERSDLIHC